MPDTRLSIRLDLTSGDRIGPGKIALLEAIQASGSISGAARALGMSYRRAWLLVEEINESLQEPAVTAATGGRQGGGAALTPSGERVIELYRSIEDIARSSAKEEFRAVGKLPTQPGAAMPVQFLDLGPGQAWHVTFHTIADCLLRICKMAIADRKSVQLFRVQLQFGRWIDRI